MALATRTISISERMQAIDFLRDYRGGSRFLLDLQGRMGFGLSERQIECVLDNMARDEQARFDALARQLDGDTVVPTYAAGGTTAVRQQVPEGTYTVVEEGSRGGEHHRTFRIKDLDAEALAKYNLPAGAQILKLLVGPDNESSYDGCAWVVSGQVRWFKRYREAGDVKNAAAILLAGDYKAMGMAYALESGSCWRCGRTLTVPASIANGLGPDCATREGYGA